MTAFGWSAGDLVHAVTIIYKIGKALKDSGGASDDYQEAIGFLHGLALTLNTLRTFDDDLACPKDAEIPRAQVDCVRQPVEKFLTKIDSKFESKLGTRAEKGFRGVMRGGHRRVEWALFVSKEAEALGRKITVPLCAIQIRLGMRMLYVALFPQYLIRGLLCSSAQFYHVQSAK